jgi:hypothetical protein
MEGVQSVRQLDDTHLEWKWVSGDLERFKEFIEKRQTETGGWRGEVREGTVTDR